MTIDLVALESAPLLEIPNGAYDSVVEIAPRLRLARCLRPSRKELSEILKSYIVFKDDDNRLTGVLAAGWLCEQARHR